MPDREPNARVKPTSPYNAGELVRAVGEPFMVSPGFPSGRTWQAAECPDHKLRPFRAEDLEAVAGA